MIKRKLTITYQYYPSNTVIPVLRVQGCWLEKLGFKVGDKVEIYQVREDELIIWKVDNDIKINSTGYLVG
ncbi:MAG TPA: SymE family type I addiction module toxin [Clostridiales bacterium]|nr:SymE family type I addiction module toxin [Clostridiales bacterium]